MGFLDNIFKDDKKKPNPLGNMFGGQKKFHGGGQALGGSQPGTVHSISLPEPGPLGVRVEKRSNSEKTAIVHEIVPGGQAEKAGMLRGDILCFAGSNGQEEIMYDMFLDMARSDQRPIELEVRRISTSLEKKQAAARSSGAGKSADAEARRKAVIAAAEAREKAHKIKSKPMKQVTKSTLAKQQQILEQQQLEQQLNPSSQEPKSEASRLAAEAAKQNEAQVAAQLGYNPYEISRSTAGQARNATTAVQHGTMNAGTAGDHLPSVAPPRDATTAAADDDNDEELPLEFQQAKATMVSATADQAVLSSSLNIMKKLLINATTKGQKPGEDSAKFRKVRLANPKIKAALVDVEGAVELMMVCGFTLQEQEGESVLLYPADTSGPDWLSAALKQLDQGS
ncbi:unnamed protein product [Cylindrotheca closterium]|uniref:PDZ domain-containing protein n=1 Tax=Cylindrotheca closterium TaxID=2856 RepID=A0AAD2JP49_9STRA|nr:unnamed protein product [Cylindrotheca closterium]